MTLAYYTSNYTRLHKKTWLNAKTVVHKIECTIGEYFLMTAVKNYSDSDSKRKLKCTSSCPLEVICMELKLVKFPKETDFRKQRSTS